MGFASCNSKHNACCRLARIDIDSQLPPAGTHRVREYCGHKLEGGECQEVSITVSTNQGNCTDEHFEGVSDPSLGGCGWLASLHPPTGGYLVIFLLVLFVCCCACFCCYWLKSRAARTEANSTSPTGLIVVGRPVVVGVEHVVTGVPVEEDEKDKAQNASQG